MLGAPFTAYEIKVVAEYPDPGYGTFCEPLYGCEDTSEAIGFMVTIYGRLPSGEAHAITDVQINEDFSWEEARDYARRLAASIAGDRPVYDETWPEGGLA